MKHSCNTRGNLEAADGDGIRSGRSRGPGVPGDSSPPSAPPRRSPKSSTTPHGNGDARRFRITHPFHPLFPGEFELVEYRHNWGEHRVFFYDAKNQIVSIPANWTSLVEEDPFIVVGAGRAYFRPQELLQLGGLIEAVKSAKAEEV